MKPVPVTPRQGRSARRMETAARDSDDYSGVKLAFAISAQLPLLGEIV
jgi:hypothetical protein